MAAQSISRFSGPWFARQGGKVGKLASKTGKFGKIGLIAAGALAVVRAIEPHVRGAKKGSYEALGIYNPVRQSLANMNLLGPAANIAGQRADMINSIMPGAPFQTKAAMANPMRMMMMNPLGMGMWGGGMGGMGGVF